MYEEHDTEGSRTEISWFSPHGLVTTLTELLHSTFHSANLQCHGWPSVTLAQDGNALHKVPNWTSRAHLSCIYSANTTAVCTYKTFTLAHLWWHTSECARTSLQSVPPPWHTHTHSSAAPCQRTPNTVTVLSHWQRCSCWQNAKSHCHQHSSNGGTRTVVATDDNRRLVYGHIGRQVLHCCLGCGGERRQHYLQFTVYILRILRLNWFYRL